MLFNSYEFIGLLSITFCLYYLLNSTKHQVLLLILASFTFYAWHTPVLLILLIFSCLINITTSYLIAHDERYNKKMLAWIGVSLNLLILCLFKYGGLLSSTLISDASVADFFISIPLPIGISFFTFQGISLVVDVYKENHFKNKHTIPKSFFEHFKNVMFFISFFPQLVAGPIVKAHEFLPQINRKSIKNIQWEKCFKEIILGFFLKMVIADNLKDFTFWIGYPYFESKDSFSLITMLFGYSCQIYADFAGYSLIAIGVARLLGYNLNDNFNFPYISSSFKEFWKRWHISLSSFLQEYLYIPLGGNRKGKLRTYLNLMITMVLGGLWHGAAWSYAVWGAFHGLALAIERLLSNHIKIKQNNFFLILKTIFVFSMVSFAWLFFKLPNFSEAMKFLESIPRNVGLKPDLSLIANILVYSAPVVLHHFYYLLKSKKQNSFESYKFIVFGIMIFLIITSSGIPGSFIYFQF